MTHNIYLVFCILSSYCLIKHNGASFSFHSYLLAHCRLTSCVSRLDNLKIFECLSLRKVRLWLWLEGYNQLHYNWILLEKPSSSCKTWGHLLIKPSVVLDICNTLQMLWSLTLSPPHTLSHACMIHNWLAGLWNWIFKLPWSTYCIGCSYDNGKMRSVVHHCWKMVLW